jgi:hypothetical protein
MMMSKRLVVMAGRRSGKTSAVEKLVRDRVKSTPGNWTLTIEGEGEHPESLPGGEDEAKAITWAERLIRRGDYDLADGDTTTVTYYLRRGDVQLVRHVEIEG